MKPRRARRLGLVWIVAVGVPLLSCTSDSEPESRAPPAKYTVQQFTKGREDPVLTVEGRGDFRRGVTADTRYIQSRPFLEQLTFGNVTYTRRVDEEFWVKDVDAATPEAKALISVRTALFDPSRSLDYLRSVSTEVTAEGREDVRGDRTTRHRATVDLGRAEGPPGYLLSVEVWVDEAGRTRRLRYPLLGESDTTVVWELYDFGAVIDVSPPPSDKVR